MRSERITIPGTPILQGYARLHAQYGLTKDVVSAMCRLDDTILPRTPGDNYYAVSFFSDWGGRLVAAFIVYVDKHVVVPIRDVEGLVYTAHHGGIHAVTRWVLGAKLWAHFVYLPIHCWRQEWVATLSSSALNNQPPLRKQTNIFDINLSPPVHERTQFGR